MLLKVGSRNEVKQIQEFLGIIADGIFGKGTEFSVKEFQKINGLVAGIVGPSTWDCMGLATTDDSEKSYETENGLIVNRTFYQSVNIKVESQKKNTFSYTTPQDE